MAKPSERDDWDARKESIIGLGERSLHKSYYPQLRQNMERLERFHLLLDQTPDCVILVSRPENIVADANAALGRLLGKPVESLIGQPYAALGLGDSASEFDLICGRDEKPFFLQCQNGAFPCDRVEKRRCIFSLAGAFL